MWWGPIGDAGGAGVEILAEPARSRQNPPLLGASNNFGRVHHPTHAGDHVKMPVKLTTDGSPESPHDSHEQSAGRKECIRQRIESLRVRDPSGPLCV